jgi:hypothetical protein
VLSWKELRDKADATGNVDVKLQLQFLNAIRQFAAHLAIPPSSVFSETYGGYQYWEHMDKPNAEMAAEAQSRWNAGGASAPDIAGYIRDSRASVKELLASAILTARLSWGGSSEDSGRLRADAWAQGTPPADYDMWNPYAGRTTPPQGYGAPKDVENPEHGTEIIANEAQAAATKKSGAITDPAAATKGFGADPSIADKLGRASHLIEDFFAHSNFVELAARQKSGQPVTPGDLRTGTFETPDKFHSLAGKLRDAAAEMHKYHSLLPLLDTAASELKSLADASETTSKALGPPEGSHTK